MLMYVVRATVTYVVFNKEPCTYFSTNYITLNERSHNILKVYKITHGKTQIDSYRLKVAY